MKPTVKDFLKSVAMMASSIPFFPSDEIGQLVVVRMMERFVNTKDELDWLADTACGSIRDWQRGGGIPELRGLFCTRFKPADGIMTYSVTPGYRTEDLEADFFAKEREENERRYEEYKRLAGPDAKLFPLPKPKLIQ